MIPHEAGGIVNKANLERLNLIGFKRLFAVTRAKGKLRLNRLYSGRADKSIGSLVDQRENLMVTNQADITPVSSEGPNDCQVPLLEKNSRLREIMQIFSISLPDQTPSREIRTICNDKGVREQFNKQLRISGFQAPTNNDVSGLRPYTNRRERSTNVFNNPGKKINQLKK